MYLDITAANEDLDGPKEACPPILGAVQLDPFALQAYLPLEPEADLLIEIFFQKVNPFIRMLNKKSFFADLARFRAGQLPNANIFVALLFSIFGLAVASLLPSDVSESFGVERGWLLHKYQEAQEVALHRVDFVNSNKLSVFQAFLYYLVSAVPGNLRVRIMIVFAASMIKMLISCATGLPLCQGVLSDSNCIGRSSGS